MDVKCMVVSMRRKFTLTLNHPSLQNKTTDVVIHQHSRKPLMMDILMSETCWAHEKWNKITSDMKLVFHSSTITMMHGPINIRYIGDICCVEKAAVNTINFSLMSCWKQDANLWNSSLIILFENGALRVTFRTQIDDTIRRLRRWHKDPHQTLLHWSN